MPSLPDFAVMDRERNNQMSLGDDCCLDLDGTLLVKDGKTIYMTPIAFRLLLYLAEHVEEIVPSDDLFVRGWGKETMA